MGSVPTSIPSTSAGMSSDSALSPDRLHEAGIGPRPALVTRDVEPRGVALGVGPEGIEIGRLALVGQRPRVYERALATAASGSSAGSTPSMSQLPTPTTRLPPFSASAISDSVP